MADAIALCKKLISLVVALSFSFSNLSHADSRQEGWYIGWGYTNVKEELDAPEAPYNWNSDYSSSDAYFNFGYNFTRNFVLEADVLPVDEFRVFGRLSFPFADRAEVYLRAGGQYENTHSGRSNLTPMIGAGVRYYFNTYFGINLGMDYGEQNYRERYYYADPVTYQTFYETGDEEIKFKIFNASFMWHF